MTIRTYSDEDFADYYIDFTEMLEGFNKHITLLIRGFNAHNDVIPGCEKSNRELRTLRACFEILKDDPRPAMEDFFRRYPVDISFEDIGEGLQMMDSKPLHGKSKEQYRFAANRAQRLDKQYRQDILDLATNLMRRRLWHWWV